MNKLANLKLNDRQVLKRLGYMILLSSISLNLYALPQISDNSTIQGCSYINNVEGTSGYGKKLSWQSEAKDSALKKAEKLGASHVVWEKFSPVGAFNGIAVAKAYKCS